MDNKENDDKTESVDKIEILETTEESDAALDKPRHTKKDLLELEREIVKFEEEKNQEEKVLQVKRAEISIKYLNERISKLLKYIAAL